MNADWKYTNLHSMALHGVVCAKVGHGGVCDLMQEITGIKPTIRGKSANGFNKTGRVIEFRGGGRCRALWPVALGGAWTRGVKADALVRALVGCIEAREVSAWLSCMEMEML
jgi:hypothetical protein